MPYRNRRSTYCNFILIFVVIKVGLNLLAISHFGFHRDELLHLALGDHLDWGYKEVPPFIALLAKVSTAVFGDSVFAARIFTTIGSGIIIWLTGLITVELGGRKFAITLACLSMIFAPAFAASGYLFQPVVFDQLWWVLTVWLIIKYINTSAPAYIYLTGIAIGLGMLTKYTMAFFALSLIIGLLISKQRKVLLNKHVLGAIAVALLLFLPNLIWQWQHHFPVVGHMKELRSTQLEYIKAGDFIMQQLMVNGIALFVWLVGLAFLLLSFRLRKFQFLGFAYIIIFIFLLKMDGKNYYLFGAYPMLFAAGGYGFDRLMKTAQRPLRIAVVLFFALPNLILLPIVLPVLPLKQTLAFFKFTQEQMPFLGFITTWEDRKQHPTTQDYADMLGWDEMAEKVAKTYHSLSPEERSRTQIFAENYGQAGAIHHYRKQYNLPDVVCLNSSFSLWAPQNIHGAYIIYIGDNDEETVKKLQSNSGSFQQAGEVEEPLAREKGTAIYLLTNPSPVLNEYYRKELTEISSQ
ncbi:glycosyltransferase family 39 protein [Mucilaginibacter gynuensis]|uniref:Glycosyltransferase family 39 protein n=1 Tax=Mucilaginibacter gynuensis TaxID=1302236 RepID=A0ABP8HHH0_9SPHI